MHFTIKYKTRDQRKCSLFTVEGCSPKTNRVIFSIVKYTEKMGPGKSVHYGGVFNMRGFTVSGFLQVLGSEYYFWPKTADATSIYEIRITSLVVITFRRWRHFIKILKWYGHLMVLYKNTYTRD